MDARHTSSAELPRIVSTEGVCGGRPRIDGTRIRVLDIYVWHDLQGKSPEEIVSEFPQLSMADVHVALTYYWAHHAEFHADYEQQRRDFDAQRASQPSLVTQRRNELGAPHAADDPVSS